MTIPLRFTPIAHICAAFMTCTSLGAVAATEGPPTTQPAQKQGTGKEPVMDLSWSEFSSDVQELAAKLKTKGPFKGMIVIAPGGLVPAALLYQSLKLPIDTISVESYVENSTLSNPEVIKRASVTGDGEGWLVVDDLANSGETILKIREMYPKAHIAVMYAKSPGESYVNTCVKKVSQDTWIILPWEGD